MGRAIKLFGSFVTLSKNFVSYAVIISTALDSYATRYIAMEYHKRDFDKANSYVSSAFYGDTVIASIILAVGVIFVLFMERFLNVSPELLVSVKLLFLLVFVNFFFTTIKTVFNSTAYIPWSVSLHKIHLRRISKSPE